jgi:hypothetical protein
MSAFFPVARGGALFGKYLVGFFLLRAFFSFDAVCLGVAVGFLCVSTFFSALSSALPAARGTVDGLFFTGLR